jgi:Kdo2-lipid IVA lauroyltransferase/acyltransferase
LFLSKIISSPFILYGISDFLFVILYYIIRFRRKVAYNNLLNSFPGKSDIEIKKFTRHFFRNFCDYLVESIGLISFNEKRVLKIIDIDKATISEIDRRYTEGKNLIMLTGHCFNWELMCIYPKFTKYKILAIFKPLSNAFWGDFMKSVREKFGAQAVDMQYTFRILKECERRNELAMTYVLADQRPFWNSSKVEIDFFNQKTMFYNGIEKIAKKLNSIVYFVKMDKLKRGKYKFSIRLITDKPSEEKDSEIIQKYAEILEENIKENIPNWLWGHKRWKK